MVFSSRLMIILLPALLALWSPDRAKAAEGVEAVPAQTPPTCLAANWPQDNSDLQPDPSLVFGRLANGLGYVLMANSEPKNRVGLYLMVRAGSLNETEDQRGLAHFLEHMLFNGTTHYPPGTLIEYFQSIGMGFGGDTNARTGFDQTVYNLMLPSADEAVMADGFKVLADYARGALLLEGEVNRERGVILSEKRSRDSAAARVSKKQMEFDFAGTLVARRDPIGVEEVLNAADSRQLRAFYDSWYRPDNMTVVVVGDMRPPETIKLLETAFAGLTAADTTIHCPELGQVKSSGTDILVFPEPELGTTSVALAAVNNRKPQTDSQAWEREQLQQYLASILLDNRLKQLEQRPNSPLAQPKAHAGLFLKQYNYVSLTARTEARTWQEALSLLQTTLAQALRDGFTADELTRGKREIRAMLDAAVQTASSRDSRQLADEIIRKLGDDEVILSPEQEMALHGPVLDQLSLAAVNDTLRQLWNGPRRQIHLAGIVDPGLTAAQLQEQVGELYQANQAKEIPAWVEAQHAPFPYLALPADAGNQPLEQVNHQEIGVKAVSLGGGVLLNIKPTDFQANQLLLSVQFGSGRQAEPVAGMALAAEALMRESGLGRLSREQLSEALAGTNVRLDFTVGPESFSFNGSSLRNEFETLLQLLRHRLHDSAFRPEDFRRSRENLRRMYDQLAGTAEGIAQIQGERFLANGSPEYGLPAWSEVEKVDLAGISQWLTPALAQEPLEINVVGDVDPAEVIQLVRKYFGAEQRQAQATKPAQPIIFPAGEQLHLQATSTIDRALLMVAWQTDDFWDIDRTRRLNLLASVFDDRLRVKIREELGATYSPWVDSRPSRASTGFGLMKSSLIVAPDQAESLARAIRAVAAGLVSKGIGEDELNRALSPTITSIKDLKRNNRYWLESVLNLSSRHPQQLQWPLTISEGFAAIKADQLTELARRYLAPERAATVIVGPQAAPRGSSVEPPATQQ
ncbi:MAG: insulinase family protein [Proteobacteria bacterium]|nr:insulinase family protein [Pseudomonadota bacterium]